MAEEKRKRILSGIQPTGTPTLGNYIGAVRNWALLQSDYDCLYMVADLHSLTVRQVPADLRRRTRELAALLLAVGIDPKEHVLFVQSHVPAHTELAWVLACNTQFGELSRMTQFKDKSAKHPDNVNGGLFTYPVLMAADILIYNADLVPVGQDQTQHLEIARDIAGRFNGIYGDTFTLPEGYVPAAGAKIMSLAEPTKKMSKSDTNINSFILMTDDKDAIVRKFKRAVTDSDGVVRFDRETKPGVSNLMCIYSTFTGKSNDEIAAEFEGKGYGDFKLAVAEVTADALAPVQTEYARILADKAYVDEVLKSYSLTQSLHKRYIFPLDVTGWMVYTVGRRTVLSYYILCQFSIRYLIFMKGAFPMLPCQKNCHAYCPGCHKSCPHFRAMQEQQHRDLIRKKEYLRRADESCRAVLHQCRAAGGYLGPLPY